MGTSGYEKDRADKTKFIIEEDYKMKEKMFMNYKIMLKKNKFMQNYL